METADLIGRFYDCIFQVDVFLDVKPCFAAGAGVLVY